MSIDLNIEKINSGLKEGLTYDQIISKLKDEGIKQENESKIEFMDEPSITLSSKKPKINEKKLNIRKSGNLNNLNEFQYTNLLKKQKSTFAHNTIVPIKEGKVNLKYFDIKILFHRKNYEPKNIQDEEKDQESNLAYFNHHEYNNNFSSFRNENLITNNDSETALNIGDYESNPIKPINIYTEKLSKFKLKVTSDMDKFSGFSFQIDSKYRNSNIINDELQDMENIFPCDDKSSIFVLFDEVYECRLMCLISGPIDSPYAHGLYLFDIMLPKDYPESPPKISFRMSNSKYIKIHPDIHNDGTFHLSILDNWETKSAKKSSLAKVILSIQSTIMNNTMKKNLSGSDQDDLNDLYQWEARYANIKHAIIGQMKNPPDGFYQIVHEHFSIKKKEILESVLKYSQSPVYSHKIGLPSENPSIYSKFQRHGIPSIFSNLYSDLEELFENFEN